jgi:hypothetical protein
MVLAVEEAVVVVAAAENMGAAADTTTVMEAGVVESAGKLPVGMPPTFQLLVNAYSHHD